MSTENVKVLKKASLNDFVSELMKSYEVIGVTGNEGSYKFSKLDSAKELQLGYDATAVSPKQFIIPHKYPFLKFKRSDANSGEMITAKGDKKRVLFGVHPYDIHAIKMMDKYFDNQKEFVDTVYKDLRANLLIVGMALHKAPPYSFTKGLGTYKANDGYDLMITDLGDSYAIEAGTKAGSELLAHAKGVVDAGGKEKEALANYEKNVLAKLEDEKINWTPEKMATLLDKKEVYGHQYWKELGEKCLSCGSCVMVCPTCYCFDVQDEVSLKDANEGLRKRLWDACTIEEFTKVGNPAGHREIFRKTAGERVRHRIYRKSNYLAKRLGDFNCVGCGRCQRACLTKIASPNMNLNKISELAR